MHLNYFVHIRGPHQALYGAHLRLSRRHACDRRSIEFSMKLGSALSNWRKLHGGLDLLGSCNRDCFAVIPRMIVLSLFPDPYFRWGKFVPELKRASGTVTIGTIQNKRTLVSSRLFFVMETVQTGAGVAKRIIKKSKFFCVVFKEVVSCFFQALDIFFRLGSTEFLKNKIPWIGRFFGQSRLIPHQIPTQWLLPVQLCASVQCSPCMSRWTCLVVPQNEGFSFQILKL